jgi:streptogramin lyase
MRLLLPLALILFGISSIAAVPPEIVAQGKHATGLVEIGDGRAYGSAFCIDASEGYFVTNAHVANALNNKKSVTLILNSGETNQRKLKAVIVRTDADLDLALLRVNNPVQLTGLSLGSIDDLVETANVTAFGFPFGKDLSLANDEYPNVTVSTGHITSLRKIKGELAAIQVDAQLNPGNSGGPVLNDKGKVVGIVVAGIDGTGIDFAIPISHLAYFLTSAAIDFTPPAINADNAHSQHDFAVHVSTFKRSAAGLSVSLTLSSGPDDHRTATVREGQNQTYTIHATPLPGAKGQKMLRLTAEDSSGKVTCLAPDQNIAIGGRQTLLSAVKEINREGGTQVRMADKEIKSESVSGLENIETRTLGVSSHMDLSHATKITVESAEPDNPSIKYHIVVTQNGTSIGELSGTLLVDAPHAATVASARKSARVELLLCNYNETHSVKRYNGLTGEYIDDFASGNGLENPFEALMGPDGNLYVSDHSTVIHRYNGRTGQFIGDFVTKSTSGGAEELTGMAFGPDGNLYASSKWTNEVKRYDGKTGAFIDNFVRKQSGRLNMPYQITFGPGGNLYVADIKNNCIKIYNGKTGVYLRDFVSGNGIAGPFSFCFGPDGLFYVSCSDSKQIKRFNGESGQFVDNYIDRDTLGGDPVGIAFGPDGNLYVGTFANDVKRFNGKTGKFIDVFTSGGSIDKPQYITFRNVPDK